MMRRLRRNLTLALAAGALAGASPGFAPASSAHTSAALGTVSCGQTVTASVTLDADLTTCPGPGLVIGADGITVNLNGHTISGTNAPKCKGGAFSPHCMGEGISNSGHPNVKITNGTIASFRDAGIALHHAGGSVVSKLVIRGVGAGTKDGEPASGIFIDHSPGVVVQQSVVTNHVHAFQADGIDVFFSARTTIKDDRLTQNAWNGLVMINSPGSRVVGNALDDNGNNGFEANVQSDGVVVSGNHADHNHNVGIAAGALRNARIVGNRFLGNGQDGLILFDLTGSVIKGNRATANKNGINLSGGQHGSKSNQLLANVATSNKEVGIWLDGESSKSPVDATVVSRNTASGNGRPGGLVVEGTARGNNLRGNTADGNAGHGISAVGGTIDGGGNTAHGNRLAPQCIRITCV